MNEEFSNQQAPTDEKQESVKPFSSMSPVSAAFIALIGIFFLYQFGGALLTILIFGLNIEKADVNAMRLLTMGGQILLLLLPTLIFARHVYKENTSLILRTRIPSIKEIGIFTIGLILLTPLLQYYLYVQNYFLRKAGEFSPLIKKMLDLLDQLDKLVEQTYGNLLTSHSIFEASFIIFVVAVVPAICEETLFRGFVQKSFEQKLKPFWSIIITAIFFGLYHFNPYGLIALIALGAFFGYAAYTSNSIFVPMSLHFINNFLAVLLFLILGKEELINTNVAKDNQLIPSLVGLAVLGVLFISFLIFVKSNYHKFLSGKKEL